MSFPLITVGMPAYNRGHVIKETIQQVLDQSYQHFELIIYNDGSTDNTSEIVAAFSDTRIIFLDNKNLGPPHPLNGILQIAKGEYIIILHDHDFFHPQLLEKSLHVLQQFPEAGFVLQGSAWIDEDGVSNYREMLHELPLYNNGRKMGEKLLTASHAFDSIFHACCMVKRKALEAAGWYYDNSFGLYADTDLWFRLLRISDFVYLREVLFKFRTREVSGHFLDNRGFEILEWTYEIHQLNIRRYFEGSDKLNEALQLAKKKRDRRIQQLTLQFAANKNLTLFQKGLLLSAKADSGNGFLKYFFRLLSSGKTVQMGFSQLLAYSNSLRKWAKN